ncbi:MAG: GNAT family N-acetyltransferase [Lutibacter sp.]|nr:MAG: GNAT family N-acetyltransferase [Lutibacter sp.]
MKIEIIPFQKEYSSIFYDLNIEWLETFFYVEEHDKEVLSNPQTYIIDNGGFIFFAKYNGEIVGTVALMNENHGYELSKMAVSPDYQGLKIGQLLMNHCISFAKNKKWDKLLLYSSTKLKNAIYIYKKYGFEEIIVEKNSPYERSDIKMILKL